MNVFPMKITGITKVCHAEPGQLIQLINPNLTGGHFAIVASPSSGQIFNLALNSFITVNSSSRCKIFPGAAIVSDYIENA